MALTPDGRKAFSFGEDGVRVWNLDTGREERMLTIHVDEVSVVTVTPDGRRAVSGGKDGILLVWNLDTGAAVSTLTGHAGCVEALALTPNEWRAISGGDDRTLRLWELNIGGELGRVALDAAVTCVAVVPGQPLRVVAGDTTGTVYCLEWVE